MPFPSPRTFPGPNVYPGDDSTPTPPPPLLDAMVGAEVPHFALPFRFSNGAASVVEQDTSDDVLTCVLAILLCPMGYRVELPDFGLEDPTFDERAPDIRKVSRAILQWEPRADALLDTTPDQLDELAHHVAVRLGTRSAD